MGRDPSCPPILGDRSKAEAYRAGEMTVDADGHAAVHALGF
jgi:hypothetical protein